MRISKRYPFSEQRFQVFERLHSLCHIWYLCRLLVLSDNSIKRAGQALSSCFVKCMRLGHNSHMAWIAGCGGKEDIRASRTYILDMGSLLRPALLLEARARRGAPGRGQHRAGGPVATTRPWSGDFYRWQVSNAPVPSSQPAPGGRGNVGNICLLDDRLRRGLNARHLDLLPEEHVGNLGGNVVFPVVTFIDRLV